ncbi:UDP-N-acetylglucosamine 1-carboxyvinyltransferase [Catenulispora sp. MAP5-51]|uniref:UDP-N-acetylglucosamine 1-carboxyvinyltransferase n=1 Tax=Catenulispora sp. MAP5-51 TaxID=3156298 RepID=UPI0035192FD0
MRVSPSVIEVRGGIPLQGTVSVDGSKNACLPLLAAAATLGTGVRLTGVPDSTDVVSMIRLLDQAGWPVWQEQSDVGVGAPLGTPIGGLAEAAAIRASHYLIPALLSTHGTARLPWPGGSAVGDRGMQLHFAVYEAFGDRAEVDADGYVVSAGQRSSRLAKITLPFRSRGATIIALLRAVVAGRAVRIEQPNTAPETQAVISALRTADWECTSEASLLTAVPPSTPSTARRSWAVPGDWIEAGTLACAIAATGGSGTISGADTHDLVVLVNALRHLGVAAEAEATAVVVDATVGRPTRNLRAIATRNPGGLEADFEPALLVAASGRRGRHRFADAINPGRHGNLLPQLARFGLATKPVSATECLIEGPQRLSAATVEATDVYTGTALLVAGCAATGTTVLHRPAQIRRGHPDLPGKLRALGAEIKESR